MLATGGEGLWAERAPALPELLDATAVPPPNRSGDREAVYVPGLPASAPIINLPLERVYHTTDGEARAEATASPPDDGGSSPDACGGLLLSGPWLSIARDSPRPCRSRNIAIRALGPVVPQLCRCSVLCRLFPLCPSMCSVVDARSPAITANADSGGHQSGHRGQSTRIPLNSRFALCPACPLVSKNVRRMSARGAASDRKGAEGGGSLPDM